MRGLTFFKGPFPSPELVVWSEYMTLTFDLQMSKLLHSWEGLLLELVLGMRGQGWGWATQSPQRPKPILVSLWLFLTYPAGASVYQRSGVWDQGGFRSKGYQMDREGDMSVRTERCSTED